MKQPCAIMGLRHEKLFLLKRNGTTLRQNRVVIYEGELIFEFVDFVCEEAKCVIVTTDISKDINFLIFLNSCLWVIFSRSTMPTLQRSTSN